MDTIPNDWGEGYDNVYLCCTAEDQANADYRLPIFHDLPAKHKMIMVEPMFSKVDLSKYLATGRYMQVVAGGECSNHISCRTSRWSQVKYLYDQCKKYHVSFVFERTGTKWISQENEAQNRYTIIRNQGVQVKEAAKINLNYWNENKEYIPLPMKFTQSEKSSTESKVISSEQTCEDNQLRLFTDWNG